MEEKGTSGLDPPCQGFNLLTEGGQGFSIEYYRPAARKNHIMRFSLLRRDASCFHPLDPAAPSFYRPLHFQSYPGRISPIFHGGFCWPIYHHPSSASAAMNANASATASSEAGRGPPSARPAIPLAKTAARRLSVRRSANWIVLRKKGSSTRIMPPAEKAACCSSFIPQKSPLPPADPARRTGQFDGLPSPRT
jgi:hypothetical protein